MYYYILSFANKKMEVLRKSDKDEYDKVTELTHKVNSLISDMGKINDINNAYQTLQKTVAQYGERGQIVSGGDINACLSGYLFRVRKYLDNWEAHIKRNYDEASGFLKRFKDAAAHEYDSCMEYRIMYQLRNFDQHCDSIVSSIGAGLNEKGEKTVEVKLSKQKLLTEYSKWKAKEKEDLASLGEEIDAIQFLEKYHECILRIHQTLCEHHMSPELYNDCEQLIKCANEFGDKRNSLHFAVQETELDLEFWKQPTQKLSMTLWCVRECHSVLLEHIKGNYPTVRVLCCGKLYKERLRDAAIEVKYDLLYSIGQHAYIRDDIGNSFIRYCASVNMSGQMGWALLFDARFPSSEMKKTGKDFERYLQAILNE